MRRVRIDDPYIEGAVLARDITSPTGDVLARTGLRLTARAARALHGYGAGVCFIEDAASVGVTATPLVDPGEIDAGLYRALRDACAIVWKHTEPAARQPTTRAIDMLKDIPVVRALDASGATDVLRAATAAFVDRSTTLRGDSGFLTDRQATDDIYGHSVGVAALSVHLAAEIGFQQQDLYATALAAITHDIGMLLVPEDIRRTPEAQRTGGQQRRYEDHTALGEALLRGFERRQPALPIVAAEHHEHQSGGGYPRNLTGGNRVLRPQPQPDAPRRITLVSEIVAVADRFERLTSPAPGQPAFSPAAARRILADEAGPTLNAEVVGRFLDLLPVWPLGTEVVLHGGEYEGYRAVVTHLDTERGAHGDHPTVRIFANRHGERVEAIELRLAAHAHISLTAVDQPLAA